jgi:hypothetical protein
MLLTLLVVGMLVRYAANSDNWRWVDQLDSSNVWAEADDPKDPASSQAAMAAPAKAAPAKAAPVKAAPTKSQPPKPVAAKPAAKAEGKPADATVAEPSEPPGLTDEDAEEADSAQEELQAVGDRTLFNQPEEMLAYNRLVKWTRSQTAEAMLKRANRRVLFNDFIQSPDKWRGKLVSFELTALRAIKYDARPDDNPLYANLYEVWGFTSESKNWLYEFVVVDPPKGLPLGPSLWEKVRVVGYFFKVQGYQPAGAKVNDPPLFAPMFIGRLTWTPPVIPRVQSADYLWAGMVAGLFGLIMIAALAAAILGRRRRTPVPSIAVGTSGLTTDEWLDRAAVGEAPLDGDSSDDRRIDPPEEAPPRAE